jgi:hypothetical protein
VFNGNENNADFSDFHFVGLLSPLSDSVVVKYRKQSCPAIAMQAIRGEGSSYSFLHWIGVSGQHHAPTAIYTQVSTPGTHWIGGWVSLKARLDTEARGKISAGDPNPIVQSVVRHYTD